MNHCRDCSTATERCRRCGHGTCLPHLSTEMTCNDCDLLYYESRDRLPLRGWFALGFALPWLVFVAIMVSVDLPARSGGVRTITTGFPALDLALMTLVVAWFSGKAAVVLRCWRHRQALA